MTPAPAAYAASCPVPQRNPKKQRTCGPRPARPKGLRIRYAAAGTKVLFMDGQVEFLRYPNDWPVCRAFPQMMDMANAMLS